MHLEKYKYIAMLLVYTFQHAVKNQIASLWTIQCIPDTPFEYPMWKNQNLG